MAERNDSHLLDGGDSVGMTDNQYKGMLLDQLEDWQEILDLAIAAGNTEIQKKAEKQIAKINEKLKFSKRALCMLAAILLVVAMMLMFLTGCNRQVIDTTFSYDNAILALPDGSVISGKIESWKDYDDGDQIQVKIDGTTYLVHSANIALIKE